MAKISDDAAVVAAATLTQAEAYLKKTAGTVPEDEERVSGSSGRLLNADRRRRAVFVKSCIRSGP